MPSHATIAREDRVLQALCSKLSLIDGEAAVIVSMPDRDATGRGGCDAIIARAGRHWALEHTSLDSYPEQRLDSHAFALVERALRPALLREFPPPARVDVSFGAMTEWDGRVTDQTIESFVQECLAACRRARSSRVPLRTPLKSFSFPVWITRQDDHNYPRCSVGRFAPEKLESLSRRIIEKALDKKGRMLETYRRDGYPTILILDSDDISLCDHFAFPSLIQEFATHPAMEQLQDIFLADSSLDPVDIYPLKLGERIGEQVPEFWRFVKAQT